MMANYLPRQVAALRRDEGGQVIILMALTLPAIFLIMAWVLNAGYWAVDHRLAQNQADAAVLAAVQYLPAAPADQNYFDAMDAVDTWLTKNGSGYISYRPGYISLREGDTSEY